MHSINSRKREIKIHFHFWRAKFDIFCRILLTNFRDKFISTRSTLAFFNFKPKLKEKTMKLNGKKELKIKERIKLERKERIKLKGKE